MSKIRPSHITPERNVVTVRCPGCGHIQFMMEPNAKTYIERICRCKTMIVIDGADIKTVPFDRAVKSA